MKLLIMQFSPTSYHFISLQPKYCPHHHTITKLRIPYYRNIWKVNVGIMSCTFCETREGRHIEYDVPDRTLGLVTSRRGSPNRRIIRKCRIVVCWKQWVRFSMTVVTPINAAHSFNKDI
jgi:hypothetical protein